MKTAYRVFKVLEALGGVLLGGGVIHLTSEGHIYLIPFVAPAGSAVVRGVWGAVHGPESDEALMYRDLGDAVDLPTDAEIDAMCEAAGRERPF